MFDARKARKLARKVRDGKLNRWEQLQQEIRERAFRGESYLPIDNDSYLLLSTTLEVFGYKLIYNEEVKGWQIEW